MDQLDNDRQVQMLVCNPASCGASQKRNQRAHPFAATIQRVTDVTLDRWIERFGLPSDALRHFVQVPLHH
jgi:2-hydroxychromene-2-carboxylate isomerase